MPDAKILVVDDERDQCAMLERILKLEGYQVASATSGQEAVAALEAKPFDVVLSDLRMPDLSGVQVFEQARARSPEIVFIILTAYGTVESAVEAMKGGIYDYIEKPINADKLVRVIQHALETQRLKRENVALRQQITATREYEKIVGSSKAIRQALECVSTVAGTGATVLIQGESGTGKELVANLIHASSPRAGKPLI
ncbi:MAG: sigma-54-dependent Fis family transcriptional regulator, partial [Planctomycetes bacterium]|nr:sigma-54-dependent Fis family transcriptional regulator [Planctomycetota bacterium]